MASLLPHNGSNENEGGGDLKGRKEKMHYLRGSTKGLLVTPQCQKPKAIQFKENQQIFTLEFL